MKEIKQVLLIDDDNIVNYLNQIIMSDLNITKNPLMASNGEEGIKIMEDSIKKNDGIGPELIILDINMPVLDGFGFLEAYKQMEFKNKEEVKIIMLSTSVNESDLEKAKKSVVTQFINKPLTKKLLTEIINNHF